MTHMAHCKSIFARRTLSLAALLGASLLALGVEQSKVEAKEPVERFLDSLRRLEMHDISVMYLSSLRSQPNLEADLRAKLPYEEGVSLMAAARASSDLPAKLTLLDQSVERFQEFVRTTPRHARVAMANTQMGNILVERAKVDFEKSKKPINAGQKEALVSSSKKSFEDARKVFEEAEKQFEAKEQEYPKLIDQRTEAKLFEERAEVRQDYMQSRLFAAGVLYEHAQVLDKQDPRYQELLTESARRYEAIFDRWRQYVAGLYALMWAGRNHQDLGDRKKALALYSQLLTLDPTGDEVISALVAQTLQLAITAWIHPDARQYDEAIKQGEERLAKVKHDKTVEWLGVHWVLSEAYILKADAIQSSLERIDQASRKRLLAAALEHAKLVASVENEHRKSAQERVAKLGGLAAAVAPPKTFADACKQAQDAVESSAVLANDLKEAQSDAARLAIAEKKNAGELRALGLFRLALQLKDQGEDPVSIDLVNHIRHRLCRLHFQQQNFYDAAVIGEFLGRRYPASLGARQAARIALACYVHTYNLPNNPSQAFDLFQIEKAARLIVDRWPGEPESDEALMMLAGTYLHSGRVDEAIACLGQITPNSPIRPLADIKAGHALWSQYVLQSRSVRGNLRPESVRLRLEAETLMKRGILETRKQVNAEAPPSLMLLTSEISLAQLYLETGRTPAAIQLLEWKPMGLLELAAQEVTKGAGALRGEIYKAGLRAYVNIGRADDAERMMDALDKGYVGEDEARLTQIYLTLGKELERQLGDLPDEQTERTALLDTFERFLSRITQRTQGNTYATLNWVANTCYALGKGAESRGQPTAESKKYFNRAAEAYVRILAEMERDQSFVPQNTDEPKKLRDQAKVRLRVKLADCTRRVGDFGPAISILKSILVENPTMLEAQLAAAYTYQDWGGKDNSRYKEAVGGLSAKDAKTRQESKLIWGWAHMSSILQRSATKNPSLMHHFHESRFNLNRCRLLRSAAKAPDDRKRDLKGAQRDIEIIARLYPDLGGPDWSPLYKKLYSEIRTALNNPGSLEGEMAKMNKPL